MTGFYIFLFSAASIVAYLVYREIRNLKEGLLSARAQIYVLKRDLITSDQTVRSYQMKLGEIRNDAAIEFEKVGENITVEEAISFLKGSSDDKN